jgi:hypothetical protein
VQEKRETDSWQCMLGSFTYVVSATALIREERLLTTSPKYAVSVENMPLCGLREKNASKCSIRWRNCGAVIAKNQFVACRQRLQKICALRAETETIHSSVM